MELHFGLPGTGKTLYLVYKACALMQSTIYEVFNVYDEIESLNSVGFNFSKNFEHLIASNFDISSIGCKIPDLRTYKVNPFRLGMPSKDFKTDIFPFGFNFLVTECQNYWPSDMWQYLRPEVKTFWQTKRHGDYDFILDCQAPMDLAKPVRVLVDTFYEHTDLKHIYKNGVCVGHEFYLNKILGNSKLEEYLRTGNINLCEQIVEKVNICLFDNYDSYFCRMLHINGREKQDYKIIHFGQENDSDILTAPDGYFNKKTDRQGLKKEEVVFYA